MTRKETALDALNKKIPKLEEKINQDKQLLEELKAKRETLEVEALKKFLHDNGMTTDFVQWLAVTALLLAVLLLGVFRAGFIPSGFIYTQF